jgi:hypothetical protein
MDRPEEATLSREEGEALLDRLAANTLTTEDRQTLGQVVTFHFWLLFALREAKLSLRRLRVLVFGEPSKPDKPASSAGAGTGSGAGGPPEPGAAPQPEPGPQDQPASKKRRRGHGRQPADAYQGAQRIACHHEELALGERCPACGRGRLYRLPPGVEVRLDGHALLSAVRYELEKLRCSACGAVFTAPLPPEASSDKYSPRARAALALGRYYLGVPLYRLEGYQAFLGVPVPDATQWDQIEQVADCAYPVFRSLERLAAQGEIIYQDDTSVRILTLIAENRQAETVPEANVHDPPRTGMYTTSLVVQVGEQTICLYYAGRPHAGENLDALLRQRQPTLDKPVVMSDALASNAADEQALIRCHCLVHAQRKFHEVRDAFPAECQQVLEVLGQVFEHDAQAREWALTAEARLAYHQVYRGPLLAQLKTWLERQETERLVEPNSSLGKAIAYLVGHWETLTRFLSVPGAPLDNNTAERALKLMIRQRKNSLFYATEHSAYVASLLTSLIATCVQAGVNALEYLVALQEYRTAVFAHPAAWLPWTYQATLGQPQAT